MTTVEGERSALRALAWWDDRLVAESTATVRVEEPDGEPTLWFPLGDVRADGLPDGVLRRGADGLDGLDHDHERVRVELVDPVAGLTTFKRFPTWGDAAHVVDLLDVRPDGERRYVTSARADWRRPVVEGSQILGQAIVAAGRHAPRSPGRVGPPGVPAPGRCRPPARPRARRAERRQDLHQPGRAGPPG